jgi:lipopolysaccharide/colanic/teichoic acid biosynthesis glycosyltransferase
METTQRAKPSTPPVFRVKALAIETVAIPAVRRVAGAKEVVDIALALALFALALPVMALALAAVRATSRGPAIYRQTRLGRGGVPFTILKIRTMRHDAEGDGQARWATAGDRRVTGVGRVLRTLHIDELPQFWNVLRGEMSLVGPRPERPEIIERLRVAVPRYDTRHAVKPGLTGLAQIYLPPDESIADVKRKLVHDRFYIRHASLGFDLAILGCTVLKLFGLKRLYRRK